MTMKKSKVRTRKTKNERLTYQLEQIQQLWLDMDEFPVALDTEEVGQALRAAQANPSDKEMLIALVEALQGLEDEMYDNLRVTPQDCFNLAVGLEKFCK